MPLNPRADSDYREHTSWELVRALTNDAVAGTQRHEEIKGALHARLIADLIASLERQEKAATRLSNTLLWLNVLLGIFTVVGTMIAVVQCFR